MRLKSTIYESTLSTADAVPLPQWGRQRGIVSSASFTRAPERRPKKNANPASLRSAAPSKGRGSCGQLPPSYGRRCPEGAEVGWGKQDERSEGRSFQLRRLRQYPNTAQRLLSGHCPKRGKEGFARRFAWPLISPKILIKVLAMDPLLCYNTESAGMARLF